MTKQELGDMVLLLKGYSNQDSKLDIRLVWILADIAVPKLIEAKIKEDGESIVDLFIKPYELEIKTHPTRNKDYVELPTYPINVLGKLIKEISTLEGDCDSFVLFKTGEPAIYCNLEAGNALGRPKATTEGKKIFLSNVPPLVDNVLVKYIPRITELKPEDEIPVPPDYELDLVNMIKDLLEEQKLTKEDKYNDSEQFD